MCFLMLIANPSGTQQMDSGIVESVEFLDSSDYLYHDYNESLKRTLSITASFTVGDAPQMVGTDQGGCGGGLPVRMVRKRLPQDGKTK